MSETESIAGDASASILLLFLGKEIIRLRKAIAELRAIEEDATNIARFEIESRNRKSVDFKALNITLKIKRETVCTCHGQYVWDCETARDGQAITTKENEVSRYVDVTEKPLPHLKAV